MKLAIMVAVAIALGLTIAYIDSRPNWDDAGITAGMLLLASFIVGAIDPPHAWIYALATGIWIPLHGLLQGRSPSIVLVLAFPFAGAYAGVLIRQFAFRS
jgi:hypothetical protein